jgi:S-formylglutathione hydrolase FrmB
MYDYGVRTLFLLGVLAGHAAAQSQVIDITIHSAGLEHNLLGDPADQHVSIYVPDAYAKDTQRRFPVLIFLHGYSDATPDRHAGELRNDMDRRIASGAVQPMILVLPNGLNKYLGSFYANSSATGNWDDFIVRDVVGYIDKNYRTQASPEHRGIAGHSMGGYGALTLAFRHPDVFGFVYAMSPCCTDLGGDLGASNPAWTRVNSLQSPDEVPQALKDGQFFVAAMSAMDAALAPDPHSKTFGDPPFVVDHGEIRTNPEALSHITANMPVNMVFPLLPNIRRLHGIFIEYGAQENFTHIPWGANELSQKLAQAGVSHTLEVFQGDHGNHFDERLAEHMLPWMSKRLNEGR